MSTALIAVAAVLIPFALLAYAQSSPPSEPSAPPGPGPLHAKLDLWVGTWEAEVEMMGQTSRGVETCKRALGDFWLVTDFEGSFMGAPFQGHGLTGVDPAKNDFLVVWADSSGSGASVAHGNFSADGKRFIAEADGLDMTGKPARFRHVTSFDGKDARTFEILQVAGGKEELAMRIRYTRRALKK